MGICNEILSMKLPNLDSETIDRIIEMAWEDRTPFEALEFNYGLTEADVIRLMQQQLKPKAFRNWRARVSGRKTKHTAMRSSEVLRAHCSTQYKLKSK